MVEHLSISGRVEIIKYDELGNIEKQIFHNVVTTQGSQLIADSLTLTPVRQKIDSTHGFMVLGTGWTGTNPAANSWVNTQVGNAHALYTNYPQLQSPWGQANGNVVLYRAVFPAGSINAVNINEVALTTASASNTNTSCLAYAQITPPVTMSLFSTLEILWYISIVGT
jgi:hypothetical protein